MLMKYYSITSVLIIPFFILLQGQDFSRNESIQFSDLIISHQSDTTYKIIASDANTYGYEILINGKPFIRQKNIPGIPGSTGFKRKEDAEKAAKLVLKKINAGIMPPSIDKHELDSMKIKY